MFEFAARAISSVLTVVYLLTTIGSCSAQPVPDTSPPIGISLGQSSAPKPLNILQSMPEISGALQQVTEQYGKTIKDSPPIHIQTVSGRSEYRAALRSGLLAGEPVDLFHIFTTGDAVLLDPYLEELSSRLSWISDGLVPPISVGSNAYGLPYSMEGVGLIVNRGIFTSIGVNIIDLNSYDSISEAFDELQQQIDAGELQDAYPNLIAVTSFAGQDSDYLGRYAAEVLLTDSFSTAEQAFYSPTVSLISADVSESFFKLMARYSPFRWEWPTLITVPQNQMLESGIATGRVAAILHGTEIYRRICAVNPDLEDQLALLPVCFEESEDGGVYLGAPAYWAINADASNENKEHAANLLHWLYRTDEGAKLVADAFRACSPYRDTASDTDLPIHQQLLDYAEGGHTYPRIADEAPKNWGEEVIAMELQQYYSNLEKEWEDVVRICEEQWTAIQQENP